MMEAISVASFNLLFGQSPNTDQMREIEEYTKDLRNYFQSFDKE